ncbi:MAG: phage tail tape measure protein [Leptothrix sp. (in: b-proteobacteria)]
MSDKDKSVEYAVTANAEGFQAEMQKVAASAREASSKVSGAFGEVGNALKGVTGALGAFTALLAGGAAFGAAISATRQWGAEVGMLSKQLGVSTAEATAFKVATERLGISSETLVSASDKLAKGLNKNEGAFKTLGIETRNANGSWKTSGEMLPDVIEKLRAIDNPMQQNIAGQQLFGKGWGEIRPILKMTGDEMATARDKVEKLHLAIDPAQAKAYKTALNDVGLVGKSLELQVGRQLLPVLTNLGQWFADTGPAMVNVFTVAIKTVAEVVAFIWRVISGVLDALMGALAAMVSFIHGDYAEAWDLIKDTASRALEHTKEVFTKIGDQFADAPALSTEVHQSDRQNDDFSKDGKDTTKKEAAVASRMAYWEALAQEDKVGYAMQNEGREMSKADELAFWEDIKQSNLLSEQELVAYKRKAADLKLAILKEAHAQELQLTEHAIADQQKAALHAIEMDRLASQMELDAGNITKAQMLQQEQGFEDRKNEILRTAIEQRRTLLMEDPTKNAVALAALNSQLLDLELQHQQKTKQIEMQSAKEMNGTWKGIFDQIGSGFNNIVTGLLRGTTSIMGAFKGLFNSVLGGLVNMLGQWAAKWAATQVANMVMSKTVAASEISTEAGKAGAGGVASMAAAPWPLNMTAPAFGAAMMAAAAGFGAVASAAGGFDIPGGLNPLTQLHEREMVLPAHIADPLRQQLASGGMGGGGDVHVSVKGESFGGFFLMHKTELVKAIKAGRRGFDF